MNETVLLTFTDVDEGRINTGQDIFNRAEIDVPDLITTLGNDEFINPFIRQHRRDPQLLRDDNVLGHRNERSPRGTQIPSVTSRCTAGGDMEMGPVEPEIVRSQNSFE